MKRETKNICPMRHTKIIYWWGGIAKKVGKHLSNFLLTKLTLTICQNSWRKVLCNDWIK